MDSAGSNLVKRIGRNVGRYGGECIDIEACVQEVRRVATSHGWTAETLPVSGAPDFLGLRRLTARATTNIYISAGIHGDEPAAPLAVRELLEKNEWPDCANVWLCPCLNPSAFPMNTRESAQGVDLNRDYRHLRTAEVRAHIAWLEKQPRFDLSLCLHEDWEAEGFYVYDLNPDKRPSLAERMVDAVRSVCPIDHSTLIDGRDALDGIIRPSLDPASRPDWPEAFYLITHKTRLSYTLEAPSDFPLRVRVDALVAAVQSAVKLACSP